MWAPGAQGKVTRWSHVRSDWPDRPVSLFGPGPRSGTFDFFTMASSGVSGIAAATSRPAKTRRCDRQGRCRRSPGTWLCGVRCNHERHRDKLKALRLDDLDRGDRPRRDRTVARYGAPWALPSPFTTPLYLRQYTKRIDRPEVEAFVDFFTRNSEALAIQAGCIPSEPPTVCSRSAARDEARRGQPLSGTGRRRADARRAAESITVLSRCHGRGTFAVSRVRAFKNH